MSQTWTNRHAATLAQCREDLALFEGMTPGWRLSGERDLTVTAWPDTFAIIRPHVSATNRNLLVAEIYDSADAAGIARLRNAGPAHFRNTLAVLEEHAPRVGDMFTDEDGCQHQGCWCNGCHGISKVPWPCPDAKRAIETVEETQ